MYQDGTGVPQDYKEAVKWYRLAAEQGMHSSKQSWLHVANGHGVPQDNTMAHMWFNIGSANGYELGGSNRDILSKKMTPAAHSKSSSYGP
ncbi:hypothetical protein [uncultured Planktomarina sp.]|uniref:tetratricopeptide repeat protein n=1 Tax=uncultured Planktomarina sp. TaxID=1538529 RepID=UPI003261CD6E